MMIRIFNSYEQKVGHIIIYYTFFIYKYHKNLLILHLELIFKDNTNRICKDYLSLIQLR
jgi:hypothetical protein